MWHPLSSSRDIDVLMTNANWFHDATLKGVRFEFCNYVDEAGSFVMNLQGKSFAYFIFQLCDSRKGRVEFEMKFIGVELANLVGESGGYDGLITSANAGIQNGRVFWAAHENWNGDVSDRNVPWVIAETAEWRLIVDKSQVSTPRR